MLLRSIAHHARGVCVRPLLIGAPQTTRFSSGTAAATLSMDLLKDLRARTGAPIVECKKALLQGANDLQNAVDWLREHGAAKASSKVAGRESVEGLVGLSVSPTLRAAALVKIASETDFAGRSAQFVQLVSDIADATLQLPEQSGENPRFNVSSMLPESCASKDGKTVKQLLDDAIVAIRENISVADAWHLNSSTPDSIWVGYVHNRVDATVAAGTAAAVVELAPLHVDADKTDTASTTTTDVEQLERMQAIGKKLAMHIVAARPTYLSIPDIPADVVEKERTILTNALGDAQSGKPADIVAKIVNGKLRKFYESVCLLEQEHMIEEGNPKVSKHLAECGLRIVGYESLSIA
jgi:elongation factor Ts